MISPEDKIKELETEIEYWKGMSVSSQLLPFWVPRTDVNKLITEIESTLGQLRRGPLGYSNTTLTDLIKHIKIKDEKV